MLIYTPKERRFLFIPDAGSIEIGIEVCLSIVMRGDLMPLTAFFVEPNPPALSVLVIIFGVHVDHRRDACEGKTHEGNERPIAEANKRIELDRVEEGTRLVGFEHRRLATLHDMLRPSHGCGRIHWNDLTRDEKIEEHPDRGQVLLHGRSGARMIFNVRGDDDGGDFRERADAVLLAPREELAYGLCIGSSRVLVPDRCGEKFYEAPGRGFTRPADGGRQPVEPGARKVARWNWYELGTHGFRASKPRRRYPNSSGSKNSAGSISVSSTASSHSFHASKPASAFRLCSFFGSFPSPN